MYFLYISYYNIGTHENRARRFTKNTYGPSSVLSGEGNGEKANLQNAELYGADLANANLKGVNLAGANLRRALLWGTNLEGATYNSETIWPDGYKPQAAGAVLIVS
jgi:uncharacterized protein YjbI with pentapeptide repeats